MACKSGNVQHAAEKTNKAMEQLKNLELSLESRKNELKWDFYGQIDAHLKNAGINDALEIQYESNMKTEYASEFSIDKVANVVKDALKAASAIVKSTTAASTSLKPEEKNIAAIALSEESVKAYCDVVTSVAEAAKSSSKTAASLSFSMIPLSPGIFAFLSARSTNLYDADTFGTEAITSTAIFYRIMMSVDALKRQAEFIRAQAALQNASASVMLEIENLKEQAQISSDLITLFKKMDIALADDLANSKGTMTVKQYMKTHAEYTLLVKVHEKEFKDTLSKIDALMKNAGFKTMAVGPNKLAPKAIPAADVQVLKNALSRMSTMGVPKEVIELHENRINTYYY